MNYCLHTSVILVDQNSCLHAPVESKISAGLLKIVFSLCIVISLAKTIRRNVSQKASFPGSHMTIMIGHFLATIFKGQLYDETLHLSTFYLSDNHLTALCAWISSPISWSPIHNWWALVLVETYPAQWVTLHNIQASLLLFLHVQYPS